jgi:cytochrome P450
MEPMARARAVTLIESFREKGSCEVMQDFAFPFAVNVFLNFLGLPYEQSPEFLGWAKTRCAVPPRCATPHAQDPPTSCTTWPSSGGASRATTS